MYTLMLCNLTLLLFIYNKRATWPLTMLYKNAKVQSNDTQWRIRRVSDLNKSYCIVSSYYFKDVLQFIVISNHVHGDRFVSQRYFSDKNIYSFNFVLIWWPIFSFWGRPLSLRRSPSSPPNICPPKICRKIYSAPNQPPNFTNRESAVKCGRRRVS